MTGTDLKVRAALQHAALMLMAMAVSIALGSVRVLALAGVLSLLAWVWGHRRAGERSERFGVADAITASRVMLCAGMGLLDPHGLIPWAGVVVLVVFTLDGLDGWWARRTQSETVFGAAFDQEADAFLVAVACVVVVKAGVAPGWVLLTGAMRYGYVLVVYALRMRGEAPRSTIARYVFGVVVVSMAAALLWPHPITRVALSLAAALLVWSFARSLWWSWRGPVSGDPGS